MSHRNSLIPADAVAVTPNDTTFLNLVGLYVGGTGDVVVTTAKGNDVTLQTVPAGAQIALGVVRVKATGTTATKIVGYVGG